MQYIIVGIIYNYCVSGYYAPSSGLETRECGRRDPSRRASYTLYRQNLALTSPINGGLSVGIIRSRTQAKEFSSFTPRLIFFLEYSTSETGFFTRLQINSNQLSFSLSRKSCVLNEKFIRCFKQKRQNSCNNYVPSSQNFRSIPLLAYSPINFLNLY
jgi:hypothetical protein